LERDAATPAVAALAASYLLPLAVVAPWAGVLVDRAPLRRILVGSDLARAATVFAMSRAESVPLLCVLLFALQSFGCFFNPAQSAAVARLVAPDRLLAANALTAQAAHGSKIAGPALAGFLVGAFGAAACFLADVASFVISALLLLVLPVLRPRSRGRTARDFRGELREGIRQVACPGTARSVVIRVVVSTAALGTWLAVFPAAARDRLGAGARETGMLLSALGAGAVMGAALVVPAARAAGARRVLEAAPWAVAAALAAASFASGWWSAAATSVLLGATIAIVFVPAITLLQREAPAQALGRVIGIATAAAGLAQAGGAGIAGLASRTWDPLLIVRAVAGVLALAAAGLLFQHRRAARETVAANR
jgi:predicted MFS family arabinose efflux permease